MNPSDIPSALIGDEMEGVISAGASSEIAKAQEHFIYRRSSEHSIYTRGCNIDLMMGDSYF